MTSRTLRSIESNKKDSGLQCGESKVGEGEEVQ